MTAVPTSVVSIQHRANLMRGWLLVALFGLAALARIAAFFWLPNIDGDAYCYLEKANELRAAVSSGDLRVNHLFFFWLPLYPLLVSFVSFALPAGAMALAGKLVSAAAGLAACWFVYRIVRLLTHQPRLALVGAFLVAIDPWQLLYSANTMTEALFEAFVLAALDAGIRRRWITSSVILVLAGFLRIEAWPLAALIPAAIWLDERRIRILPVVAVFIAPCAWLAINWINTGDALAYFHARNAYVAAYLEFAPERLHPTAATIGGDLWNVVRGANFVLLAGAFAASGTLVGRRWRQHRSAVIVAAVFLYLLAFVLAAYTTRAQPVLWIRYGVIYEPLGVCLTLWWVGTAFTAARQRTAFAVLALGIALHLGAQTQNVVESRGHLALSRRAAHRLASLHPVCTYCDNSAVREQSGLPADQWRDFNQMHTDLAGFTADLVAQHVDYLVFSPAEASTPVKLFPELARFERSELFEPVARFVSTDWRPPVFIYRVLPPKQARIDSY